MTHTTVFSDPKTYTLVLHETELSPAAQETLGWLLNASPLDAFPEKGPFIGPRREMITPWSTNAVEIATGCGVPGLVRMEAFRPKPSSGGFDPMLEMEYPVLSPDTLSLERQPEPIRYISDIREYNREAGLALSEDEVDYLEKTIQKWGRPLTDSEVFGFAQVNSEHCRHKIFNGEFIIDGTPRERSLFQWIKATTQTHPGQVITRYNDNVAFIKGPSANLFAPEKAHVPSDFQSRQTGTVLSLKAETHNFPTTVEPFNGAATGSGGEIRDRMAGGRGSFPLVGTACYMTAYPRIAERPWASKNSSRPWLYQSPQQILTKASNGASDFGNKFGQPLINGSLLTFEWEGPAGTSAFDKTVMLAGGVGYALERDALKNKPKPGDKIILMGGDNYRIGLGGGAVSSLDTGSADKHLELNAVQRSNPEMQKRVYNCLRGLLESTDNPVVLIHDHGAGGHVNCLSELVEGPGGIIYIEKLPVGDPSLSDKEIIGNESQERMGLVVAAEDAALLDAIARRERAPMYVIGEITGDERFVFVSRNGEKPVDVTLDFLFGKPPKTVIRCETLPGAFKTLEWNTQDFSTHLRNVLRLEGVGCKDWLTNKVDRSVTGRVAQQQCVGPLQLPLHGAGVACVDHEGRHGIATAMGHAPAAALIDPGAGSELSISEALLNLIFVPIQGGLGSVTLGANWMWPCKLPGEDARLYAAVQAASEFATALGINISTGKDSLSMTQKYPDGSEVPSPGTVIVSAVGACHAVEKIVTPDLKPVASSEILYVNACGSEAFPLGGSALAQTLGQLGDEAPQAHAETLAAGFETVQELLDQKKILAGQDVSGGGAITALLEMAFAGNCGFAFREEAFENGEAFASWSFCEKPGLLLQIESNEVPSVMDAFGKRGLTALPLGEVLPGEAVLTLHQDSKIIQESLSDLRKTWFEPSYHLEAFQVPATLAKTRFQNFDARPLSYSFPSGSNGDLLSAPGEKGQTSPEKPQTTKADKPETSPEKAQVDNSRMSSEKPQAAILREKGTNGEREMAYALHCAGFAVRDVAMTDITEGRETLEDVQFLVYCGGFSNSDVLGSARGWAGSFKYNSKAQLALEQFYGRSDTLSLGVCNGCQLMVLLGLVQGNGKKPIGMDHNASGKFESAFLSVDVPANTNAVLFQGLQNTRLGIWVAHGEGRFQLEGPEDTYNIALKYSFDEYPSNPNGSRYAAAGIASPDGRHLAMMPHLERSIFPWQWGFYPRDRKADQTTPWLQAFANARQWIADQRNASTPQMASQK